MSRRERLVAGGIALATLTSVGLLHMVVHDRAHPRPLTVAVMIVAYALAQRVPFEFGSGFAVPSQLVFVPMLFVLPLSTVPLAVALANLVAKAPDYALRRTHFDNWIYCFYNSWYSLAPALVIGLLAPGPPRLSHTAVYVLAFASQLISETAKAAVSERLVYGQPLWVTTKMIAETAQIDIALTPVGFLVAAVAVHQSSFAVAAVAPLFWLLQVFSRERAERYTAMVELNQAYRGTVMVLADVVEVEDDYTAHHCRSVVEIATAVADELGLGYEEKQELEIAALLHDVGKIRIPTEILNKPSRLTDEEFELMKTHTIEGQVLLDRVGGKLARVGKIVRSCHERWDGRGYPDGLKGEEIPLAARVVFCCDAWNAMTTDRPYRRALDHETALNELLGNSGTQFDPGIVKALVEVIESGRASTAESYSDAVRAVLASRSTPVATTVEASI